MRDDEYDDAADRLSDDELGLSAVEARTTKYSELKRTRVQWLWPGRLAHGKLVLLDGDPDVGKSTVIVDIAARLTTGSPMPDGYLPPCPTNVLLLRGEDGASDTVLPRLLAAGGDPARFYELEAVPEVNDNGHVTWRSPELPTDLLWLERVIRKHRIGLVIVDVLMVFLSDNVNAHKDQHVRRALSPMADVAQRTSAAIVSLRHLNKTPGLPALYRGGGSIGMIGAARVGLVCGPDPQQPDRRLFAVAKCNIAKRETTLIYRFVHHDQYDCATVVWEGASDTSAADMLHLSFEDDDERSSVDEAVAFMFAALADGPRPVKDVLNEAHSALIAERALTRAAKLTGVVKYQQARKWLWRLPDVDKLFEDRGDIGEQP